MIKNHLPESNKKERKLNLHAGFKTANGRENPLHAPTLRRRTGKCQDNCTADRDTMSEQRRTVSNQKRVSMPEGMLTRV